VCGICGIRECDDKPVDDKMLVTMCNLIAHRGPDDEGYYIAPGIGLGNRRLSVIDLATGHQPIHNEDETVWIIFNGEIYNHLEVRARLEQVGHHYYTQSDTETIVHAYEEYGLEFVNHLIGMFAFALWDARQQTLILARDRLGQKPLYYTVHNNRLLFASEVKAILADRNVPRQVDGSALSLYLSLSYVPSPRTMFADIQKLPPAHLLICKDGQLSTRRYWQAVYQPDPSLDEHTCIEQLRVKLLGAVRRRLLSDVPLGAFLSGGIDSSTVVGLMSRLASSPVKTFSVGYDADVGGSGKFNVDAEYAKIAARHFGTEHYEVIIKRADDLPTLLKRLIWQIDEPLANPTLVLYYIVSQFARQRVTVALAGDGADELFAGYRRYHTDYVLASSYYRLPSELRQVASKIASHLPVPRKVKTLTIQLGGHTEPYRRYLFWWDFFKTEERMRVLADRDAPNQLFAEAINTHLVGPYADGHSFDSFTARMTLTDLSLWIADLSNMLVDKMSMLASLEVRSPFLDHELVEFIQTIPFNLRFKPRLRQWWLGSKFILRKAFHDLLPCEALERPKWGFLGPASKWLRTELRPMALDLLSPEALSRSGFFDAGYVNTLLQEHLDGTRYNLQKVWTLLVFQLWHEIYIQQNSAYVPT